MSFKYLLFFGFITLLQYQASADVTELEPGTYSSGTINEYADKVLAKVRPAMVEHGFDPFKVDEISRDFWFKFLLINHTGHIDLKNGWLQGLSTIHRAGDAKIKYEKKMLTLTLDLVVDGLMAHFDHATKIFNMDLKGLLSAKIRGQVIKFSVLIDFERITFHLQQFALVKNDHVKLDVKALGIADPLLGIIVDALTAVFKDSVTAAVGEQIRSALHMIMDSLPPLLPPPPQGKDIFSPTDLIGFGSSDFPCDEPELYGYQ